MRAFGACVEQRDEDMSQPPKLRVLDVSYHTRAIDEAKKSLAAARKMSDDQIVATEVSEIQRTIKNAREQIAKHTTLRANYENMLKQVKAWVPPTRSHTNFKKFMIEQIEGSIKFDCDTDYYTKQISGVVDSILGLSPSQKRKERIDRANQDIRYHTKEIKKDTIGVKKSNDWILAAYATFSQK